MNDPRHRWHDGVIRSIAASFPVPPIYIEIGVATCECFNQVAPLCKIAHAVDVSRHALLCVDDSVHHNVRRWDMRSSQFWEEYNARADIIFIDGDHNYSTARDDFCSAAAVLKPWGYIILHDVWPASHEDTRPEACGDVYRLVDEIRTGSMIADWDTLLYSTFPGLLVCQRRRPLPDWT